MTKDIINEISEISKELDNENNSELLEIVRELILMEISSSIGNDPANQKQRVDKIINIVDSKKIESLK